MDLFTSMEFGALLLVALSAPMLGMVSDDVSEETLRSSVKYWMETPMHIEVL